MRTILQAKFAKFGRALREARRARKINQRDLAGRLKLGQQAVSNWERGKSRPETEALVRQIAKIFPEHELSEWIAVAGYRPQKDSATSSQVSQPVRPTLEMLPLHELSYQQFQGFCEMFLGHRFEGRATVNQFGTEGDTQDGIDIEVRFHKGKRYETYQCKREKSFGSGKVKKAMKAHKVKCDLAVILLSRRATAGARKAIPKSGKWRLWDSEYICREIKVLPLLAQRQIIDAYFRAYRKDFLGIADAGALEPLKEYFAPLMLRDHIFSHAWTLVGRDKETETLRNLIERDASDATCLVGSGGIGKTRLAFTVAEAYAARHVDHDVYVLQPGKMLTQTDIDGLSERNALVVIEDAHDHPQIRNILAVLAQTAIRPRLLLVSRPYAVSILRGEASRTGFRVDDSAVAMLKALTIDEAEEVAREILADRKGPAHLARTIATVTRGSSLALVVGSHLVATKKIHPNILNNTQEFRSEILSHFRDALTGQIGVGADQTTVREALDLAALIQPFDLESPQLDTFAKEVIAKPIDKVKRAMQLLVDAGVLVRRGRMIRIVPDLLGEYILEDTCVMSGSGTSTGYIERVIPNADEGTLANILLNVSKLDWRIQEGDVRQSQIADIAWRHIQKELLANADVSTKILEAVAHAAYYQPQRAISFFDAMVPHGNSHEEFSTLLKHVAMNMEFMDAACERMWSLASNDYRPLNRYPEHPNRVLCELAHIEPGKPIEFSARIVNFAMAKIRHGISAFDRARIFEILDSALAPDGHTTETRGHTLSLKPYAVRLPAVASLRQTILDALMRFIVTDDLALATRAVGSVSSALRAPHNVVEHVYADWQKEFVQTLKRLGAIIEENANLDPIVIVAIERAVHWHAEYGGPPANEAARAVLNSVPSSLRYRVTLAMADAWGETRREKGQGGISLEAWQKEQHAIADELFASDTAPKSVVSAIAERLGAIKKVEGAYGGSPGIFVRMVAERSESVAELLCIEGLVDHESPLRPVFGEALFGLASRAPTKALPIARKALALDDEHLASAIAWAYMVRLLQQQDVLQDERDFVVELLSHRNPNAVAMAIRAIAGIAASDPAWSLKALLSIDLAGPKSVLDAFFGEMMHRKDTLFAPLTAEMIGNILAKLEVAPTIEDHWLEKFLAKVSERHPQMFVEFTLKRILRDVSDSGREFQPFPYSWDSASRLRCRESSMFAWCLRRVREWLLTAPNHHAVHFWGPKLYHSVAGGIDSIVLADLSDWAPSGDIVKLTVISRLVREAPSDFVFDHSNFVIDLLANAYATNRESGRTMESALWGSAMSGMRHGTPGEPFPEDVRRRDRATELMRSLTPGSPAWRLYDSLSRDAETDIRRKLEQDEELFAE